MDFDAIDIDTLRQRSGEKWAMYPADVLPVWVADMDFPVAEPIQRMLEHRIQVRDTGYPINPRFKDLPTTFAHRMHERYGWDLNPRHVEVLTDVVQGMYISVYTLTEPGNSVVIQTPVYPPFLNTVKDCGRRTIVNELVRGNSGYEIDFDGLRASIDANTKMLLFCNPQNPTGRAFTRSELERVAEVILEHNLYVCADEIHQDLVFPGHKHIPFASLSPEIEARTITLTSATKAFNIAGLRCAVVAFGSQELQERFGSLPKNIRGGLGSLGLAATEIAWTECQSWLDEVLLYLDGNRDFVKRYVSEHFPEIQYIRPEATYLAWLDCRALELEPSPYRYFLEQGKVALTDGAAFGPGGEGFARINFATSRAILTEALERMQKALDGRR